MKYQAGAFFVILGAFVVATQAFGGVPIPDNRPVSGHLDGQQNEEQVWICPNDTNIIITNQEILNYAEANAIDLIAMSTHGRSGIGRWIFGSVTEKLLQTGSTPILTIRGTRG